MASASPPCPALIPYASIMMCHWTLSYYCFVRCAAEEHGGGDALKGLPGGQPLCVLRGLVRKHEGGGEGQGKTPGCTITALQPGCLRGNAGTTCHTCPV